MINDCYHLCTTALKDAVLAKDREDFLFLWNCIAKFAVLQEIIIYGLCLMSNHFHILLSADPATIEVFFSNIRIQLGKYSKKKYGISSGGHLEYKLFPVKERKGFCNELAYILRNPYKSRIDSPITYSWSSGLVYFNRSKRICRPVSKMNVRERHAFLHTRKVLPEHLFISPEGMIVPESFIDVYFCEKMFGNSAVAFFDLLKRWNLEDIVDESHGEEINDPFSDEEVAAGINELSHDYFNGLPAEKMDTKTLGRLVRRVYYRYGSSRAQLQRLFPVDTYFLDKIL